MSERAVTVKIGDLVQGCQTYGFWLGLIGVFLAGCSQPTADPSPAPPPPAVTVSQPIQRQVIEWDEYTGRLEAVETVDIRARASGYLNEVKFKDGAKVKAGDLLFVIDPRPYQAELNRAEAELQRAKARLELAKNDLARAERLFRSRAISEGVGDIQHLRGATTVCASGSTPTGSLGQPPAPGGSDLQYTVRTMGRLTRRGAVRGHHHQDRRGGSGHARPGRGAGRAGGEGLRHGHVSRK